MNGYERIRAALEGRTPDHVPVMLHNFMPAAEEAGYSQKQFRSEAAAIVESFTRAVERYGYDGILVDMDTTVLAGAVGVPVSFPDDEPAVIARPLLARIEDAADLEPARVGEYRYVQVLVEAVRRLVERFRGEIYVRGNCDQCPFSIATMMRGSAELMMDLCDEEKLPAILRLLDYGTDVTRQIVHLMADTGCDMISNGDSPAGPDLISPEMYARFALPYEQRIARESHARGLPYTLHICGDTTRILPSMLASGADCLELDYQTDAVVARDILAGRAAFIGNLDPSGVLRLGTPREVEAATGALLALFADTPRFILNAGCAMPRGTPPENVHAMIRTARQFG
jgi:MtaA/CmuA family methyltransferase